ncbi:MAG: UDP-3-O-(3-hydroxymyristoyl)glucosamine N-acyltransferase [Verrucomicrobia bacterium]|nr:UDP-3-O-(3-hydroxymyristoyl)glucosamine N-acyltransferase [Verrucomicrobiota bacterium]
MIVRSLQEIAAAVDGHVEGDSAVRIQGVAALQDAQAGDLSFLASPKYAGEAAKTRASAVLVGEDFAGSCPATLVRVKNPDQAFMRAVVWLAPPAPQPERGVHPTAIVAADASLGDGVCLGPYCVIEPGAVIGARTVIGAHVYVGHETRVGEDCRLYPLVSIRERVTIGNRVILHNGAVIGSDGFGYVPENGQWTKIPQLGTVIIGDDVEIGAGTTVDRARFGKTVISRGVKIDNLVQVAHNVQIGEHSALAAQVGIAGSAVIGAHVQLGGQAGVAGHLTVHDKVIAGGRAGITKGIPAGTYVMGMPAMPADKYAGIHAHTMRLPELKKRVQELEKRIQALESGDASSAAAP